MNKNKVFEQRLKALQEMEDNAATKIKSETAAEIQKFKSQLENNSMEHNRLIKEAETMLQTETQRRIGPTHETGCRSRKQGYPENYDFWVSDGGS